jgi:hypothetical protein
MAVPDTRPLWQVQFPDFPGADMPPVPAGFTDTSWANEPCPSFTHERAGLALFTDWVDPSEREWPESDRFTLHRMEWHPARQFNDLPLPAGWGFPAQTDVIAAGDDFGVILTAVAVYALADAISFAAAHAHLAAWEAQDLKAPQPCPELLGWIADCRAALADGRPERLAEIEDFAHHLADLDAEGEEAAKATP